MTLKNAALLALIGTILATILLVWTFVFNVLNVLRGLAPPVMLVPWFIYAFACFGMSVFFYFFHRAQSWFEIGVLSAQRSSGAYRIRSNDESSIGEPAMTREEAWNLAEHWVAAWNAHDLELIMTHYEDAVELTSPVAAQLLGTSDGRVVGKANLRAYFRRGLEAFPDLDFRLADVLWGVNSLVLYYTNHKGTRTAEFMELSAIGKVARVVGNYNA
jgi:hypothetical protein